MNNRESVFEDLSDEELLARYEREGKSWSEHYPCDDQCHDWMDEIAEMSAELTRRGIEHEGF